MRVLLTGSNGFVGSAIRDHLLEAGQEVIGLVRKSEGFQHDCYGETVWDISTSKLPNQIKADAFVHCAGLAHQPESIGYDEFEKVNVRGTANALELAKSAYVKRFINISSISVYGDTSGEKNIDENTKPAPRGHYAKSKLAAEEVVADSVDFESCSIRVSTVLGAGDKGNIQKVIEALQSKPFAFPKPGRNRKSFIHRQDVASLVMSMLETKELPTVINGVGFVVTVEELVNSIIRIHGAGKPIFIPANIGEVGLGLFSNLPLVGDNFESLAKWYSDVVIDTVHQERYGFEPRPLMNCLQEQILES